MASGVGVTYELEFVIKDKNAKQWIQSMQKEAERLAKALDKVTLNNFNKQLQHMQKNGTGYDEITWNWQDCKKWTGKCKKRHTIC